jgi:hypothetical protein
MLSFCGVTAIARAQNPSPLKFAIKVVDAATGKSKGTFYLGETVSVVFTVTNLSQRARIIPVLQDTYIPWQLVSTFANDDPKKFAGGVGGTFGSHGDPDGTVYFTESAPREMTLAAGQTVSMRLDDFRPDFHRPGAGKYRLSATYRGSLKATVSFSIVIDEAKSIPLLENILETPVRNDNEDDSAWARQRLEEIRLPSLSGLVTDAAGRPLKDVEISFKGPQEFDAETRSNGRYHVDQLTRGATYTLTPSLTREGKFDATYTFEPASRTVTNLNSKLTGLNFKATRVRPATNVAEDSEGGTARASSTLAAEDDKFEAEQVVDGVSSGPWDQCCNAAWSDATPNVYPDWVEVDLKTRRAIDWINVFTLRDDPEISDEPAVGEKFTRDGIIDFDVQYWTGRAWKNVPGGAIRGNRNVLRKIEFPTINTNKIRVVVWKALSGYSRIMEIEAFHINDRPVAKLIGQSKGRTGASLQFHANVSDRDRAIYKYTVDFGDGTAPYELEYGDKPAIKDLSLTHTHTFAKAGIYNVTLRVMDHDDEGSETNVTVTITDPPKPPFAEGKTVYQGIAGKAMFFEGRGESDPNEKGIRYSWNFDDGQTGAGSTISHTYAAPGTYTVILLIQDIDGRTNRYGAHVQISAAPPGTKATGRSAKTQKTSRN